MVGRITHSVHQRDTKKSSLVFSLKIKQCEAMFYNVECMVSFEARKCTIHIVVCSADY